VREPAQKPAEDRPGRAEQQAEASAPQARGQGAIDKQLMGRDPRALAEVLAPLSDSERSERLASLHGTHGNAFVGQVVSILAERPQGTGDSKRLAEPFSTKSEAIAFHEQAVQLFAGVIKRGLGSKRRQLRNSCEWIDQGMCKTRILTPTHDANTRGAMIDAGAAGTWAMFDQSKLYPARGGDYANLKDADKDPHVGLYDKGFHGWMVEGTMLLLIKPGTTAEDIEGTLMHEIQHQADQHDQVGSAGRTSVDDWGAAEDNHNSYQSEFRAYWVGEGGEGAGNDTFGSSHEKAQNNTLTGSDATGKAISKTTRFHNRRQELIAWHILHSYPWAKSLYLNDQVFQDMVDKYTQPAGANLINSVRIQRLTEALAAHRPRDKRDEDARAELMEKMMALDAGDKRFLRNQTRSQPFWDFAGGHLSAADLRSLQQIVGA